MTNVSIKDKLFGVWVRLALGIVLILELPLMFVLQLTVRREDRARLWTLVARKNIGFLLRIGGIHLKEEMPRPMPDEPTIFISNHPSWMDGFLLLYLLGPNVTILVAPFHSFPFPFNLWIKNIGSVDVERDDQDALRHPGAHPRPQAIDALAEALDRGNHVVMFPEGHLEREHELHYIHTGAARLSIRTGAPIQVCGLIGLEDIVANAIELPMRPGTVRVKYGKQLQPTKVGTSAATPRRVRNYQKQIVKEMHRILPHKYTSHIFSEADSKHVGVFIDVDHTIYDGYSQKDFIRFLRKKKLLSAKEMTAILGWIGEEAVGTIDHHTLMERVIGQMKGWKLKTIQRRSQEFFNEFALEHIELHMMPHIKDHQEAGHHVVIVSELIEPLAECFAEYISAEAALGTVVGMDKEGVAFNGRLLHLNRGEGKAKAARAHAIEHGLNLKHSFAYADSHTDTPLFEMVGHRYMVHPDGKLREQAAHICGDWHQVR